MRTRAFVGRLAKSIGGPNACVTCGANVPIWLPNQLILKPPILLTHLRGIGSDLLRFRCPVCGSNDRERHLMLYFKATDFFEKHVAGRDVLHFAPEAFISAAIVSHHPVRYVKADLYPFADDIEKIDMRAIPYPDSSFDLVIANHVLEHIENDHAAISELGRVLRPRGVAVLQTPYSAKLRTTLADAGIDSDYLKTQLFGQPDHVRAYGLDIFERIAAVGLRPATLRHEMVLGEFDHRTFGVNPEEPFMLFEKN